MSSTSSETAVTPHPPRVAAMFLANFDPKEGYKMVWGSGGIHLQGLEYKALPSGVHEYDATTIYLTHEDRGKLYYGTARFRQANFNVDGGADRSLVKMYSIGILVEPLKGKYWKPHEFSAVGWEHLGALDAALQTYIKNEDLAVITSLFSTLSGSDMSLELPRPSSVCSTDHPLTKLPMTLSTVGPLIFPIFKAALLRKNVLIFNHSSQGNAELVSEPCSRGPTACGALAYIISLISVIPKNVQFERAANSQDSSAFSQPLYTIGLQDMDTNFPAHYPGFIASTSDEILKYQKQLYDYAVIMPTSAYGTCQVFTSDNLTEPVKATYNDYGKFLKAYRSLPQSHESRSTGDDQSSIRTSSSIFSAFRFGSLSDKDDRYDREPAWWFAHATTPMSWREYIWSAFAWFASAGTTEREAGKIDLDDGSSDDAGSTKSDLLQLTAIVGHFHKLTKKWFFIIEEIVSETVGVPPENSQEKVTLGLTPQDIVDMELDPYSAQDLDFVRDFVLTYWGSQVDEVEVGFGIHSFLC